MSERFIWVTSTLLLASMFPLVFGLCADVYLVAVIITRSEAAAAAVALVLLAFFGVLWLFLPRRERRMPR